VLNSVPPGQEIHRSPYRPSAKEGAYDTAPVAFMWPVTEAAVERRVVASWTCDRRKGPNQGGGAMSTTTDPSTGRARSRRALTVVVAALTVPVGLLAWISGGLVWAIGPVVAAIGALSPRGRARRGSVGARRRPHSRNRLVRRARDDPARWPERLFDEVVCTGSPLTWARCDGAHPQRRPTQAPGRSESASTTSASNAASAAALASWALDASSVARATAAACCAV